MPLTREQLQARADQIFVAKRDGKDLEDFLKDTKAKFDQAEKDNNQEEVKRLKRILETVTHRKLSLHLENEQKKTMREEQSKLNEYNEWTLNNKALAFQNLARKFLQKREESFQNMQQTARQSTKDLKEMINKHKDYGLSAYESYSSSMGQMFNMAAKCSDVLVAVMPWAGIGDAIAGTVSHGIKSTILQWRTKEEKPLSLPEVKYFVEVDAQGRLSVEGLEKNLMRSDGKDFTPEEVSAFYGGVLAWLEDNGYEVDHDSNGPKIDDDGMMQVGKRDAAGNFIPIKSDEFDNLRDGLLRGRRNGLQAFMEGRYDFKVTPALGRMSP